MELKGEGGECINLDTVVPQKVKVLRPRPTQVHIKFR